MKIKSVLFAAVVMAGAFIGAAQATPTWTFTTSGTIDSGTDYAGVFGAAGANLQGLSFTEILTASVDPAQYENSQKSDFSNYLYGSFPGFTVTATVNGKTITETVVSSAWGQQYITNYVSSGMNSYDTVSSNQFGSDADGKRVTVNIYATTGDPLLAFVPTVDFGQTINAGNPGLNRFAGFSLAKDGYSQVAFSGTPTSFTVNAVETPAPAPSDVPEPASLGLIGLGFAGMGFLRRRKSS